MDLLAIEKLIIQAAIRGDEIVNLSHRGLTIVSDSLKKLKHAKTLCLNDNKLLMPPTELGAMVQLEELVLDNNQLTVFPPGVGKLQHLSYLSVCYNPLGMLPKDIGQVTTLSQLWLVECQLMNIPEELGNLQNLEKLSLRCNNISCFPKEFYKLTKLRWLCFAENYFQDLPEQFENLISLSYLNMNHNRFEDIPKCLGELPKLISLNMKGNYIQQVSDDILLSLSNLTKFDLRDNQIVVKPAHWKGLEYILVGETGSDTVSADTDSEIAHRLRTINEIHTDDENESVEDSDFEDLKNKIS
ncbi:leucine-rich repeat-containing protein 40 [Patella vulgata]|uniref:leucine-rich repeat-containing protein 40 n=1 Tax=Patella vulgata TaxID=6465 RepID=UPI0024A822FA|nr:leucine-rich repeat-containing protein 40 [Patella vulgata]XP_050395756.2 leucine-rich repeat-containing protein 40 [Patella vulgata]